MNEIAEHIHSLSLEDLCALQFHIESLIAYRKAQQPTLFVSDCKLCQDTGRAGQGYCTCETGQRLRERARERTVSFSDLPLFSTG